ncbi:N-acetylmuramoyl-L-alanine amidase [Streptomyces palmae]|uniref:N-acetylmuramoyl-L-alanine amidase n=1 Tax=Streptomyces palmae TaxID=1701085 RepID=A0A4Z0GJE1_9ACTN|nr:N-acetylmuramoyl-L-alanine amidase [Streptomyces palmae]TGA95569.1 N-acetylmuramoyl-L-alanine amidase [Streptomyces palmae]
MSNGSFPPTPGRLRGALVTVAVVAVVCAAGWLAWYALRDDGGRDAGAAAEARHTPTGSAAPHTGDTGGTGHTGQTSHTGSGQADRADDSGTSGNSRKKPLKGMVVVIDPGHNPHNNEHTAEIARQVDIGNARKECDTTGTATNSGYPEASYTLDVSRRVRKLLEAQGAKVVFTQDGDRRYGPCVDERARIGNRAHADAVVSVHADGAGPGNRGFHVIAPAPVHRGKADTSKIVAPSRALADQLISRFGQATESKPANYLGGGSGLTVRDDLGGLNLSTVPKVFIECGNMRDREDAARLTDAHWREQAARGIAQGITDFLRG